MMHLKVVVQRTLVLSLIVSLGSVQGQEVIELDQPIHGTLMTTRKGREISAYLGIPYAEPPIGALRFRNPIEWKWKKERGPIIADQHPNQCPQLNNDGVVVGDEDCLYLNVYTPQKGPERAYPVMVYFHGGNFVRGSSKEAGPEYLLDRDVVLVTVNYRLGVLGFLSTGDAASPGNFGLKDQALALRWVRKNILGFEGHPNKVTIFGQDAGGVSTILLAISHTSRGLFERYIAQSGSALAWWAFGNEFRDPYTKYAKFLGNYLECPTSPSNHLVECLRSVEPSALVDSNDIFTDMSAWQYRTWAPTIERQDMSGAFISNGPGELAVFRPNWIKDCPGIIGSVSDEGLVLTAELYANNTRYDWFAKHLDSFLIRLSDTLGGDGYPKRMAKKLKNFYFKSIARTDKESFTRNMTNLITDSSFGFPVSLQGGMTIGRVESPLYMYKFDYRGAYSKASDVIGNNDNVGVSHGDDLTYFFPVTNATTPLSESDEKMMDIMLDFWTSFATNGVPTSQRISNPNIWKPFKPDEEHLQIGKGSDPLSMSFGSPLKDAGNVLWISITLGSLFEAMAVPSPD